MQILNMSVKLLKPDPKQPRQTIDNIQVLEMAKNITHQGVINAIEIDTDNIIITGELRWRAAIKAGLKEVPTKLITEINAYDRFMRQVSENVHHNTMTPWDTAQALGKLQRFNGQRLTIRELGNKLGKSHPWIEDHLELLGEGLGMKKYLQQHDAKASYVIETNRRIPEQHIKAVRKKIIDGTIGTRRGIRGLGVALHHHPDKAEELLKLNFYKMNDVKITELIDDIAPTPMNQIEDIVSRGVRIRSATKNLLGIIKATTPNDYAPLEIPEIKMLLTELGVAIPKFLLFIRKELSESSN